MSVEGYRIALLDDYDATLKLMRPRLESGAFRPLKSLMRAERAPGHFKAVRPVCAPPWGLDCTGRYRGVELVGPARFGTNFPTTASLTPLLEWKPSPRKDVTYDVAIYESLSFPPHRRQGRVGQLLRLRDAAEVVA